MVLYTTQYRHLLYMKFGYTYDVGYIVIHSDIWTVTKLRFTAFDSFAIVDPSHTFSTLQHNFRRLSTSISRSPSHSPSPLYPLCLALCVFISIGRRISVSVLRQPQRRVCIESMRQLQGRRSIPTPSPGSLALSANTANPMIMYIAERQEQWQMHNVRINLVYSCYIQTERKRDKCADLTKTRINK